MRRADINSKGLCLIGVLIFLSLPSCVKELDTSIIDFQPRINLIADFSPENIWKIEITETQSIFDNSKVKTIEDAKVEIKDLDLGTNFFLTQDPDDGFYYAGVRKPVVGHDYEITVEADGYKSVSARAYVPSEVEYTLTKSDRVGEAGDNISYYNIRITDNLTEENYYILEFETRNEEINNPDPGTEPEEPNNDLIISSDDLDPLFSNFTRNPEDVFVEENDFSGDSFNIQFNSDQFNVKEDDSSDGDPEETNSTVSYLVKIKAVSKDLFLYLRSLEEYKNSTDLNYNYVVHSNVVNGTGIFGAYNEQEIILNP